MKYPWICLAVLAALLGCSRATSPTTGKNAASEPGANRMSLAFQGRSLDNDSSVRVFLQVAIPGTGENSTYQQIAGRFQLAYSLISDYNSKDVLGKDSVTLSAQAVRMIGMDTVLMQFDVKKLGVPSATLQAQLIDRQNGQRYTYSMLVHFKPQRFSDTYAVFRSGREMPEMKNYFSATDTLQIRSLQPSPQPLSVFRYKHDFEPALSPMATTGKNVPKTLDVDTVFTLTSNTRFILQEPGLYYFRADSNDTNGIGILIVDKRFPRMTRPEELIKPLVYISTNTEIKELYSTDAAKRTLDTYWLRLATGNESKARRTIRAYYRRVAQANQFFTTYKEGWKTDMGMVYVVFGKPDQVTRLKDREVWTYTQNPNFSEINFTFARRPNQFVENYYELVRYVEYEPIWYPTVEEWRNGIAER